MDVDREKVMKGLECCSIGLFCPDEECPYEEDKEQGRENCLAHLCRDALALIKALEGGRIVSAPTEEPARMLTFNEAMNNASNYRDRPDSVRPVFVQFRAEEYKDESMTPPWRGGVNQRALLKDSTRYYKEFVFWTERPTALQMEEVEWIS